LLKHYPALETPLSQLPKEKRALLLHCLLLMFTTMENCATFSRALLLHLTASIQVPFQVLAQDEMRLASALSMIIKGISQEEIAAQRAEEAKASRRPRGPVRNTYEPKDSNKPSALAEPLVSAKIGTVFGRVSMGKETAAALLGPMAENTVAVGTLFGLYGARATGKMMESYQRDVQDFGLPSLHGDLEGNYVDPKDTAAENRRLRMTICASGWLNGIKDVAKPWKCIGKMTEGYGLRWEVEAMTNFGQTLVTLTKSSAWAQAQAEFSSRNGTQ
jgi:hypothetical protein